MTLLEQFAERAGAERAKAGEAYREILARADNPHPGDAAKVQELLDMLGRDASQLPADQAMVAEIAALELGVSKAADLRAAVDALKKERADEAAHFEARRVALLEEHAQQSGKLHLAHTAAMGEWQAAARAAERLEELRRAWKSVVLGRLVEKPTRRDELQAAAGE